jgi:hypothetical protein
MLTGDKTIAKRGLRACQQFASATGRDIDEDQGVIMQDLAVAILHLCDQEGMDPFMFTQKALQKFEDTLVEEDY